ncbi:MAG: HEPN domain-containing protein [Candidatus Poribacteria bacterium]
MQAGNGVENMQNAHVANHLRKSEIFIEDAQCLYDRGRYDSCASRAYYAAFRAAVALMEHLGYVRPSWNHGRLRTALRQRLVRDRNILEEADVNKLETAYRWRVVADYEYALTPIEDAEDAVVNARQLIARFNEVMNHEVD